MAATPPAGDPQVPSADALGVFVELLSDLDADSESGLRPVYIVSARRSAG
jgi:hypothetical protein